MSLSYHDFTDESTRYVPNNLIPIDFKKMDDTWQQYTYKYAHMFDNSKFTGTTWTDTTDLGNWKRLAKSITEELRQKGKDAFEKHIIDYFSYHKYTMKANDATKPTNIDDIISIISDREWYLNNKKKKQQIIYMITYGMFRQGHNQWAYDISSNWLKGKNMKLKHMDLDGSPINSEKQRETSKGFVYSNICYRASNIISYKISTAMKAHHKEFICARKKSAEKPNFTYQTQRFGDYDGYIVTIHDPSNNITDEETTPETNAYITSVKTQIERALQNGVTYTEVQSCLDEFSPNQNKDDAFESNSEAYQANTIAFSNTADTSAGKNMFHYSFSYFFSHLTTPLTQIIYYNALHFTFKTQECLI